MKKYVSIMLAVLVMVSIQIEFAGANANVSAGAGEDSPVDCLSQEDDQKLLALQFDDYRHMTISEFQDKVWRMTDTSEYAALLERLSKNESLYRRKDSDGTAAFLFDILEPLTGENWRMRSYDGAAVSNLPATSENARLEYTCTMTILSADKVMVQDYCDMRDGVQDALRCILYNRTKEELQNEALMLAELKAYIDEMTACCQAPEVSMDIEYAYFPLPTERNHVEKEPCAGYEEQRGWPSGTEEDYRSLLALKTTDWASMSVADFNEKLLAWANEDFDRMARVDADTQWDDFRMALSEEERSFVQLTLLLSGVENGALIQSLYTGEPEADPAHQQTLPQKWEMNNGEPLWCDFSYQYSYHITDKNTLTVGERDLRVGGMTDAIQMFWDETPLQDLLTMTKGDIVSLLASLAAEYSSDALTMTISAEQVHFEHTNGRAERPSCPE